MWIYKIRKTEKWISIDSPKKTVSFGIIDLKMTLSQMEYNLQDYNGKDPLSYLKQIDKILFKSDKNEEKDSLSLLENAIDTNWLFENTEIKKEKFFWKKLWDWIVKRIPNNLLQSLRNEIRDWIDYIPNTRLYDQSKNRNLLYPNIFSDKIDNWDLDLFFLTSENPSIVIEKLKSKIKIHWINHNGSSWSLLVESPVLDWFAQVDLHIINDEKVFSNSYFNYYRVPYLFFLLGIAFHKIWLKLGQDWVYKKETIWKYGEQYVLIDLNIYNFLYKIFWFKEEDIKSISSYKELANYINNSEFSKIPFLNTLKSEYNQKFYKNEKLDAIKSYLSLWTNSIEEFRLDITKRIYSNYSDLKNIVNGMIEEEIKIEKERDNRKKHLQKLFGTQDLWSLNVSVKKYMSIFNWYSQDLVLIKELQELSTEAFWEEANLYLVWWCVRDIFLKKYIKDYDITGNISSEDIAVLFNWKKTDKNWTVFFQYKWFEVEYTPFRSNWSWKGSLESDAWKRDFTFNSIYLRLKDLCIIDLYDWISSINKKIIKGTWVIQDRLEEDPLRLLRSIRFEKQLLFNIESQTAILIEKNLNLLDSIARERIKNELIKWIVYKWYVRKLLKLWIFQKYFPEFNEMNWLNQFSQSYHKYDVLEHSLQTYEKALEYFPDKNLNFLLASLFHDIWKPKQFEESRKFEIWSNDYNLAKEEFNHSKIWSKLIEKRLENLKFSTKDIKYISNLVRYHQVDFLQINHEFNNQRVLINMIKNFMSKTNVSFNFVQDLIDMSYCDRLGSGSQWFEQTQLFRHKLIKSLDIIEKNKEVITIKDLKINWTNIMSLGVSWRQVKEIFDKILEYLIEYPEKNEKHLLMNYAKQLIKKE